MESKSLLQHPLEYDSSATTNFLDEGGKGGAGLSGVSLEARAESGVVVALSAASALVGVVVGGGGLNDGGKGSEVAIAIDIRGVDSLDEDVSDSTNTRGASSSAGVGDDLEEVLLSLDGRSGEGDDNDDGISIGVEGGGDSAVVDDLVGEATEGVLDADGEVAGG